MSGTLTYAIDFGTSNSLLAAAQAGKCIDPIHLDPANTDPTILRSVMYFSNKGPARFGQEAIHGYTSENGDGRLIRSIKKYLPAATFTRTRIGNDSHDLENLIGCFLREMKRRADIHFNQEIHTVVLGRPAKFSSDPAKDRLAEKRLLAAARIAGFKSAEFFPEPLAAAYDYRNEVTGEKLVLVVDLGGGTSDFTVIRIGTQSRGDKDVLSIGGVSIAGDVLDGCIMGNKIAPHLGSEVKYKLPLSHNVLTMPLSLKFRLMSPADITLMSRVDIMDFLKDVQKCAVNKVDRAKLDQLFALIANNLGFSVFEEIERCKRAVCENQVGDFKFDSADVEIEERLTYPEFLGYSQEKIDAIFASLDEVITMAQVKNSDIDSICCTGGTSKIPAIAAGLEARFGKEKIHTFKLFHSVIKGLAERAAEIS